ncbi:MAG: toxin-antitoxin system HicB family antitoxin [Solirubrobacteraceae bacterium]
MRQLIARIDDALHSRLKQKAASEGRSLNALVTEALELSASVGLDSRVLIERRAAARGIRLVKTRAPQRAVSTMDAADRDAVIGLTAGLGAFIDGYVDEDRGSREG